MIKIGLLCALATFVFTMLVSCAAGTGSRQQTTWRSSTMEFVAISGWVWGLLEVLGLVLMGTAMVWFVVSVIRKGVALSATDGVASENALGLALWHKRWQMLLLVLGLIALIAFFGASNKWRPRTEPEIRQSAPSRVVPTVVPVPDLQREESDVLQEADEEHTQGIKDRFNSLPDAESPN